MSELELKLDSLPEAAKQLTAFRRFKILRDRMNPVVDKYIDIDKLINEGNFNMERIRDQAKKSLLPTLEGYVPAGWKKAIYT